MQNKQINISGRQIGIDHCPFVIAEMSGNHNQSLERAIEIVEAVAKTGAHALKIQTYLPDTMTLDLDEGEFFISDPDSLWNGKSLYELYQEAHTPWEWHEPIFDKAKELGLIAFSTPFDASAVDFLEELDVPCYKIASFENIDLPLIEKVAATGKPMIVSTGMATVAELDEMVRTACKAGCNELILLKCTSTYPASPENSNILTISHMRELFQCQVGLSDHTMGGGVALAAVALGATVIEKHFTLCRADGGVDASFSFEPDELSNIVKEIERAWKSLGKISYGPVEDEYKSFRFRRSLYISKDMKAGDKFTDENLRAIRPGLGLPPKYFNNLIGRSIKQDAKRGTPVNWNILL